MRPACRSGPWWRWRWRGRRGTPRASPAPWTRPWTAPAAPPHLGSASRDQRGSAAACLTAPRLSRGTWPICWLVCFFSMAIRDIYLLWWPHQWVHDISSGRRIVKTKCILMIIFVTCSDDRSKQTSWVEHYLQYFYIYIIPMPRGKQQVSMLGVLGQHPSQWFSRGRVFRNLR